MYAELAWLEGGEIKKTRLSIPSEAVKAKIWPDPDQAAGKQLAGAIKPQNVEQSLAFCVLFCWHITFRFINNFLYFFANLQIVQVKRLT